MAATDHDDIQPTDARPRLEKLIEMIPVKRLGNPEFVASLFVQLASVEADFATGAAWDVNGGIFMR